MNASNEDTRSWLPYYLVLLETSTHSAALRNRTNAPSSYAHSDRRPRSGYVQASIVNSKKLRYSRPGIIRFFKLKTKAFMFVRDAPAYVETESNLGASGRRMLGRD